MFTGSPCRNFGKTASANIPEILRNLAGHAVQFRDIRTKGNNRSGKCPSGWPKIIVIMPDDLGYGNVGVYHSRMIIPTPHIDQLAGCLVRVLLGAHYRSLAEFPPRQHGANPSAQAR